ncbi:DUF484 family protein [Acidihalobacter ferrooxydans]|uniref:Phytochrome sensor protein n=1 Tax=Acidihalobacter ferrooxydans TaxID=1765967 RepID=A0A1P8UDQ8_9GAMM|nr:DUF484 family protein [Acidihalobacter ferrooxydans]APZ41928.1 phytochrome sensor protein [Acidihalobacter ferrooxydans]
MSLHTTPEAPRAGELTEEEIAVFLRDHPDYFTRHIELLDVLRLPHPTHGAVSLVERQLSLLRERNRQLERKLGELIRVARGNEQLSANLHQLALGLMRADSLDSVLASARDLLCSEFNADQVVIRVIDREGELLAPYSVAQGDPGLNEFQTVFERRRPVCGQLRPAQLAWLFGDYADTVASAVVTPLFDTQPLGLLALGSAEADRFHPSMGTLFLGYLGELLAAAVDIRLDRA